MKKNMIHCKKAIKILLSLNLKLFNLYFKKSLELCQVMLIKVKRKYKYNYKCRLIETIFNHYALLFKFSLL
jgi:hypothetical protein